jgi:SAM-dependent methyltransferase
VNLVERLHERHIKERRVRALASAIASHIPQNATVLDVGCGDGSLSLGIMARRPDVRVHGLEIKPRPDTSIPVTQFDGRHLPFASGHFDVVLFVDVLHHTEQAEELMKEGTRVARCAIVIKDHCADGFLARPTLRFMDRVGNARFGVTLPYMYLSWAEWQRMFERANVAVDSMQTRLGLYPRPLNWIFERSLHFVARLAHGVKRT